MAWPAAPAATRPSSASPSSPAAPGAPADRAVCLVTSSTVCPARAPSAGARPRRTASPPGGAPTGASGTAASTTITTGPAAANPFVKGGAMTPYIPNLRGGADIFGLLGNGNGVQSPDFSSLLANAPKNALGAVLREHIGPA